MSKEISRDEVASNNNADSLWCIIDAKGGVSALCISATIPLLILP